MQAVFYNEVIKFHLNSFQLLCYIQKRIHKGGKVKFQKPSKDKEIESVSRFMSYRRLFQSNIRPGPESRLVLPYQRE